jgi:hypothetical protein
VATTTFRADDSGILVSHLLHERREDLATTLTYQIHTLIAHVESGRTVYPFHVVQKALPLPKTFVKPALSSIEKLRDTLQWNLEPGRPVVEFISQLIYGLRDDVGIQ